MKTKWNENLGKVSISKAKKCLQQNRIYRLAEEKPDFSSRNKFGKEIMQFHTQSSQSFKTYQSMIIIAHFVAIRNFLFKLQYSFC